MSGEYVLIQDADLEYSLKIIKDYLSQSIKMQMQFMALDLLGLMQKNFYFSHRVANFIITTLVNLLTNINFTDVEVGYKLIKTQHIKNINLKEKSFAIEIELTMKLAKQKIKFYEVGISYNGRTYAEEKNYNDRRLFCII